MLCVGRASYRPTFQTEHNRPRSMFSYTISRRVMRCSCHTSKVLLATISLRYGRTLRGEGQLVRRRYEGPEVVVANCDFCFKSSCVCDVLVFFFFFSSRRRHTRFDCDWSSDVCSSDLGWAFCALVAPLAMIVGDIALRRLPLGTALDNAAHLTMGAAVAGVAYARLGGATGAAALAAGNLVPLVVFLALLPGVVNATFYIELALGRRLAWLDATLTARWEAVMYACSAGLALGSLAFAHGSLGTLGSVVIGAALVGAAVASISIIRRSVQADELALIQELSQAIARDLSLARSFPRIQKLARRLVPWEHMGFARYDAATNEMELVADTAAGDRARFRFDADAGLSGEALRMRRPVVARALSPEQVVVPGREEPGSEVLVPLYYAGQLVGDRKSTRLNSSHSQISYAVFCLKK